jgi:hypothetical protein
MVCRTSGSLRCFKRFVVLCWHFSDKRGLTDERTGTGFSVNIDGAAAAFAAALATSESVAATAGSDIT